MKKLLFILALVFVITGMASAQSGSFALPVNKTMKTVNTDFTLTNTTDHSGDAGAFNGMSVIATNAGTTELVAQAAGVKANLTAAAVFTFKTPFTLLAGVIIHYHVYGSATTAAGPFVVSVTYQSLTPAGYLA